MVLYQVVYNTKCLVLMLLVSCFYNSMYASIHDTTHIFFDLNKDFLRKADKDILEDMVYEDIINNQSDILIIGYADYLGNSDYNKNLSIRRAETIKQHLTSLHIPEQNIKLCTGNGEVERNIPKEGGYTADRRVDIVITHNKKIAATNNTTPAANIKANSTNKTVNNIIELNIGETIRLENIYFVMGRHFLTDNSLPVLDTLYETIKNRPDLKIQIEGHICCLKYGYDAIDEDTQELKLSENRAKFIYDYLVKKGIGANRMQYIGFGRTKPLVKPEITIADEDKNRRVEIRITAK